MKVKVEDIAAPGAVAGTDTVRPAGIAGKAFPVIKKVIRQFICNRNKITKKNQSAKGGVDHAVILTFSCGTDFQEEFLITQLCPNVVRFQVIKENPVAMDRFLVQIFYQQIFKDKSILGSVCLVTKHGFHFFSRAAVVPFMIPAESPFEHILSDINRLVPAVGTGHFHYNKSHSVIVSMVNMMRKENVYIYLLPIIQCVPDI